MMYLIIGAAGSGKSAYAEKLAVELAKDGPLYYIATMQPYGEEGRARVEKHRRSREGKGFVTVEKYTQIDEALPTAERNGRAVALLECLSNLTANEMFGVMNGGSELTKEVNEESIKAVEKRILLQIEALQRQTEHLVIVSNNIFEDGIIYPAETERYKQCLAHLNAQLAVRADEAWEIVYSIPVPLHAK